MKNRLQELLKVKHGPLLSVFYTAGFPKLNDTIPVAQELANAGADIIEIGIPFSDPVADGPTIQRSNKIALDNGMTLAKLLSQVKEIRSTVQTPIILMGYLNPVMQYGVEKFANDARDAGVDGLILPDMPLPEFEAEYKTPFERANLIHTFLVSPTTSDDRIRKVDALSNSFIYAVSASSTTGAKQGFDDYQLAYFDRLRKMNLRNPFLIGFGISNRETFSQAGKYAAGSIVGSAFINLLAESTDFKADIARFVTDLKS